MFLLAARNTHQLMSQLTLKPLLVKTYRHVYEVRLSSEMDVMCNVLSGQHSESVTVSGVARNLIGGGVCVLTSHCNFKTCLMSHT